MRDMIKFLKLQQENKQQQQVSAITQCQYMIQIASVLARKSASFAPTGEVLEHQGNNNKWSQQQLDYNPLQYLDNFDVQIVATSSLEQGHLQENAIAKSEATPSLLQPKKSSPSSPQLQQLVTEEIFLKALYNTPSTPIETLVSGLLQPTFKSCATVDEYEHLNQIGQGSYGVVARAKHIKTGMIVALKRVKLNIKELTREGFPHNALREMNILLQLSHPNIVRVHEIVIGSDMDKIFMVMEYVDHSLKDLSEHMQKHFTQSEVKCLVRQLLEGVKYLHENWILHRDLKSSNLLYDNKGNLKICDFGLARLYGEPLHPYSPIVVTLWYRAPELLLGTRVYTTAVDMVC